VTVARSTPLHVYSFGQTSPGLMQPTVDAHGNLWVGEMSANRLARLNTSTGQVKTWEAPEGENGIMTTTTDAQGRVWFVEQNANYLGRFDPLTQHFQMFPLETIKQRLMGPQSLQFDGAGQLWFTAAAGGAIGQLIPTTGRIRTWIVPVPVSGAPAAPFSLAVTRTGQVWFGYLTGGTIGHLDPATGHITLFHLGDPQATIFAMTSDRKGRVWFTELLPGRLGMIDPTTNRITLLTVPPIQNMPSGLYGLAPAPDGTIWIADNTASALVQYHPDQEAATIFPLATTSAPYDLTPGRGGTIWCTSSNSVGELPSL
jgi:virginiamycin B lyase